MALDLAVILCTFEEDMCSFSTSTTDSKDNFKWLKLTGEEVSTSPQTQGPDVDYNGHPNGHFLLATAQGKETDEIAEAELSSPLFKKDM